MALSFAKHAEKPSSSPSSAQDDGSAPQTKASSTPNTPSTSKSTGFGSGLSWMKKGTAAKEALAKEEAKAEMAAAAHGKLWRYWMKPDEERQVTFLDGDLDEEGMLDCNMFYEHSLKINGKYENFICTAETEGHCPICDKGDSKPYLVGVLTVVDHTPVKVQSGPNAGKIIKNSKKLWVGKKQSIKYLTKIAQKRGGLRGATFDVTRGDDKTASVGSQFDFVGKSTMAELRSKYEIDEAGVEVADYGKELTYRKPEELIELGVGKAPGGVGYEKGVTDKSNLANEL